MYHVTPPPHVKHEHRIDHRAIHLHEIRIQRTLRRSQRVRRWNLRGWRARPAMTGGRLAPDVAVS